MGYPCLFGCEHWCLCSPCTCEHRWASTVQPSRAPCSPCLLARLAVAHLHTKNRQPGQRLSHAINQAPSSLGGLTNCERRRRPPPSPPGAPPTLAVTLPTLAHSRLSSSPPSPPAPTNSSCSALILPQDTARLQKAATLRSFSMLEPLNEFKVETSELFAQLLSGAWGVGRAVACGFLHVSVHAWVIVVEAEQRLAQLSPP